MNKLKLGLLSLLLCLLFDTANAASYGDLYNVEWCPCNPEERYDAQGSVVLGKTVMCPCDSMYDGYKSTMEKTYARFNTKPNRHLKKLVTLNIMSVLTTTNLKHLPPVAMSILMIYVFRMYPVLIFLQIASLMIKTT